MVWSGTSSSRSVDDSVPPCANDDGKTKEKMKLAEEAKGKKEKGKDKDKRENRDKAHQTKVLAPIFIFS